MPLIKSVVQRCQTLLKAAYGSKSNYADYDTILSWIGIVSTDVNNRFQALGLNFDTQVVVLTAVPANTINLAAYQADDGPLANLVMPDSTDGSSPVEWRLTGQDDLSWAPVPMVGKVVDTNTSTVANQVESDAEVVDSYEWRAGLICISPCNQIVDLRIRGDFLPNFASDDAASFVKGAINVFAYWTCEAISGVGPSTEGSVVHKWFETRAMKADEDFVCLLAKAQFSQVVRLGGRRTQYPTVSGVGPFTLPVVG